jgi:hypothetical protein
VSRNDRGIWRGQKADILLPRRMIPKRGDTPFELVTNSYVIMPVPENVK